MQGYDECVWVHHREYVCISWLSKATKILLVEITPHVEHADSASVYFKHSWQCRRPQWVYPLSSRWWHWIQGAFTYWCHHKNCWSDYWIYQWMNPSCGESSAEMFSPLRQQYEFLVKWRRYVDAENTWELPNNNPGEKLQEGFVMPGWHRRNGRLDSSVFPVTFTRWLTASPLIPLITNASTEPDREDTLLLTSSPMLNFLGDFRTVIYMPTTIFIPSNSSFLLFCTEQFVTATA